MIFDNIKNAEKYYCLNENFKIAFDFLKNTDLLSLKDGSYEIKGKSVFANVQSLKTKPKENQKWELHRKYIDIQYIIKGSECMGYGINKDFREVVIPYDNDKDIEFLEGEKYNYINLKEKEFVIFYPTDCHAPMLAVNEPKDIKKVIVKIIQ